MKKLSMDFAVFHPNGLALYCAFSQAFSSPSYAPEAFSVVSLPLLPGGSPHSPVSCTLQSVLPFTPASFSQAVPFYLPLSCGFDSISLLLPETVTLQLRRPCCPTHLYCPTVTSAYSLAFPEDSSSSSQVKEGGWSSLGWLQVLSVLFCPQFLPLLLTRTTHEPQESRHLLFFCPEPLPPSPSDCDSVSCGKPSQSMWLWWALQCMK